MTNKDLISQYVDTGLVIPEYQLAKLSSNDKKTYIRKRLIGVDGIYNFLEPYELPYMSIDNKKKYLRDLIKHELVWGPDISGDIKKLTLDFSQSDRFEILSHMLELEIKISLPTSLENAVCIGWTLLNIVYNTYSSYPGVVDCDHISLPSKSLVVTRNE